MTPFNVHILGCGSAMPTTQHNPSSQIVDINSKLFMIDCGEGAQLQMRKMKLRMSKLHSIFISHLHGDHLFGLPGLLSTLGLTGRTADINVYAHSEIEAFLDLFIKDFGGHLPYKINLIPINPYAPATLYENDAMKISSFPMTHRIAVNGFTFEEKERPRNIKREMIDFFNIPIKEIQAIKKGADFLTDEGNVVKNEVLTTPARPPRKYAYCSDTAFYPPMVPHIYEADLLYHEATFNTADQNRAEETCHSTARQAAEIARMANVKKLVLGHFSSRYTDLDELLNEAKAVFENTALADEGKCFKV